LAYKLTERLAGATANRPHPAGFGRAGQRSFTRVKAEDIVDAIAITGGAGTSPKDGSVSW